LSNSKFHENDRRRASGGGGMMRVCVLISITRRVIREKNAKWGMLLWWLVIELKPDGESGVISYDEREST
jgi:hypothetical protein